MTPKTLLLILSDPTAAMMNWYQNIHHICGQNWSMLFISPSTKQYPTGFMVTTYIHSTKDVYMGWIQGTICSNDTAYLPLLLKSQTDDSNCSKRSN